MNFKIKYVITLLYSATLHAGIADDLALLNSQLSTLAQQLPAAASATPARPAQSKLSTGLTFQQMEDTILQFIAEVEKGTASPQLKQTVSEYMGKIMYNYLLAISENNQERLQRMHAHGHVIYNKLQRSSATQKDRNLAEFFQLLQAGGLAREKTDKKAQNALLFTMLHLTQQGAQEFLKTGEGDLKLISQQFSTYKLVADSPTGQKDFPDFVAEYHKLQPLIEQIKALRKQQDKK